MLSIFYNFQLNRTSSALGGYRTLLSLVAATLISANAFSQAPSIQWQKTIGGNSTDAIFAAQQTADSGFIFGGYSVSGISGDKTEASRGAEDYWVVKTDVSGNIQ